MFKKLLLTCALLGLGTQAQAVIIGGAVTSSSGTFEELSLPFSTPGGLANTVGNNVFDTNNLYAFNEGQNITLSANYAVDIAGSSLSGLTLTAGTTIASHYVFFDPKNLVRQTGYVDFDADILAVITSTTLLDISDAFVNTNVTYLSSGLRGLESWQDSVSIVSDANGFNRRLDVNWKASSPGDYVRVITAQSQGGSDPCSFNPPGVGGCPASVPEPAPLALFFLGALGLGITSRLKLKKEK